MKVQIEHRVTGKVLYEGEHGTMKEAVPHFFSTEKGAIAGLRRRVKDAEEAEAFVPA